MQDGWMLLLSAAEQVFKWLVTALLYQVDDFTVLSTSVMMTALIQIYREYSMRIATVIIAFGKLVI